MSVDRSEELAWELPRSEGAAESSCPADETLQSYREGSLSEHEQRRLEWQLARSPQGRVRLAELAGVALDEPDPRIRQRVLAQSRSKRWLGWAAVAAALLLVALATPTVWRSAVSEGSRSVLPADAEFDVRVEGLADTRGADRAATAEANGRVQIVVEPRHLAVAGLEFALYRTDGDRVTRMLPGAELQIQQHRGAATLITTARSLVGPEPGRRPFWVVVAASGRLPAVGRDPDDLAVRSGGKVYRREMTVVPTTKYER